MSMGAMMTRLLTTTAISGGVLLSLLSTAGAQTPLPPIEVNAPKAFELGQIKVGARRLGVPTRAAEPGDGAGESRSAQAVPSEKIDNGPTPSQHTDAFGGYTITNRQMETFARPTLDSAVNIAPGVNSQISGNSRNEQNIYVRGFDRWQVPLTVDGVRVYLPVDNRLDFARFLTADIAEVQIAKGYVSVLDGPGGMGGQINLVTRRPTREIEAEWRTRFDFGRDGTFLGPMTYGFVGTKKDMYYAQLSGTFQNYDGWMLPASYRSTLAQGPGMRGQSATQDYNVNARVGVTPNATDEYSLSFSRQEGQKGAPLHTTDPIASQRFWRWPYWRVQNLYFLSRTQLNDAAYVKTRGYWSKFDNSLVSYDDPSFIKQSLPKSFNSAYADYALGAEVEAGAQIGDIDTLKALFFYRIDNHAEWQENFGVNIRNTRTGCVTGVPCYTQPIIGDIEDTYSAAVENTFHPRQDIDIVGGFSYDWRHLRQAEGFAASAGRHQLSAHRRAGAELSGRSHLALYRHGPNLLQRLEPNPLSDAVRAFQHALWRRDVQSHAHARTRHQFRSWLVQPLCARQPGVGRRVLQPCRQTHPKRACAAVRRQCHAVAECRRRQILWRGNLGRLFRARGFFARRQCDADAAPGLFAFDPQFSADGRARL